MIGGIRLSGALVAGVTLVLAAPAAALANQNTVAKDGSTLRYTLIGSFFAPRGRLTATFAVYPD